MTVSLERFVVSHPTGNTFVRALLNQLNDQNHLEKFNYSKNEIDVLFNDIKQLFLADGTVDIMEENLFRALKKIIM